MCKAEDITNEKPSFKRQMIGAMGCISNYTNKIDHRLENMAENLERSADTTDDIATNINTAARNINRIADEMARIRRRFIAAIFVISFITAFAVGIVLNWKKISPVVKSLLNK